jgi:hypothetical protein
MLQPNCQIECRICFHCPLPPPDQALSVVLAAALLAAAPQVDSLADAVPTHGSLGPAATAAAAAGADAAWLGRLLLKLAVVPPFAFGALLAASGISGL